MYRYSPTHTLRTDAEYDTETLASFITDYRWENGRRYHAYRDGSYWGPNDENAQDVQDLGHHVYKLTFDGELFLAPLENPRDILDLGTGTGIWAIEMADLFPDAQVTGTDLSPTQPRFVPPNCIFEIEDVNMEWTYPKNKFDFIHIRELFGSVTDWDYLFSQAYDACRSGGWFEVVEHSTTPVSEDGSLKEGDIYTQWGTIVEEFGRKSGKSFTIWNETKERMQRAGFVDIVEHKTIWPMNAWPRDRKLKLIGQWNQLRLYEGAESFVMRLLTNGHGWSYEKANSFVQEWRAHLHDGSVHAYNPGTAVYGRKP